MSNCKPHMSIDDWLEKLDLSLYRCLLKNYSAVEDILWMSERDLKNIGIKNGSHRARMSSSLAILKNKYDKFAKTDDAFISDLNTLRVGNANKSFSSLPPVNNMNFEKPHSGVRSWPSTVPSSCNNTKHSSPRSSLENYIGPESTADELKLALEKELSLDSSDLRSYAWYHGTILRQRAEELVKQDGDFLVRDCISQPGDFVITCRWKNVPLHFIVKKVILQPDTLYERIQYCFEKESFDSIPDFITYYVGSKCPLSENTGVIISSPINRTMPLSYYTSRYGVHCQIHYAAKKLEKLPSVEINSDTSQEMLKHQKTKEIKNCELSHAVDEKNKIDHTPNLTRVGSDPVLSPNTERRKVTHRPNSGNFTSDIKIVSLKSEDKPPPKPSRVPSKKCVQRPLVLKRDRQESIEEECEMSSHGMKIPFLSPVHSFKRQLSETRFSFLDRPSLSDDSSELNSDPALFTIPSINPTSMYNPQNFRTVLLSSHNLPLEANVLTEIKQLILTFPPKTLAYHMTKVDLEVSRNYQDIDLGVGVSSGLELFLLPQGNQLQKDLLERTECMKLFVAVTLLTTPSVDQRVQLLNQWIETAIEIKTCTGNLFGFASIMLGLTVQEVLDLHSTWLALRHNHTNSAFVFETKLRPAFNALQQGTGLEAPNTCLPYLLSLILIFQKYKSVMDIIDNNPLESEMINSAFLDFDIPGNINSTDYGLQLLQDHLTIGRYIMQQFSIFRQNGRIMMENIKFENILLDMFSTEFHLRMLWGFRGSVVSLQERFQKFQKVLTLLHNKCNEISL